MKSALICSAAKLPILGLLVFTGSNGTRQKKKCGKFQTWGGVWTGSFSTIFFQKKIKLCLKFIFSYFKPTYLAP